MPNSRLWEPLKVGNLTLQHRAVMAPLTRYRNGDDHAPLDIMTQYYSDRACVPGTLIITEATGVSGAAEARPWLPSVASSAQVSGWAQIYAAVHARGSFVFQQLWDLGRGADPAYVQGRGFKYASSGDVQLAGRAEAPAPLTEDEIWQKVDEFRRAARNVVDAGGDGVEIHGAHGYLVDQFTRDSVNNRTDAWGGSVEKRSRFLLEVVEAVVREIGAERTALRLSPFALHQESYSSDTWEQTGHIVRALKERGHRLAYLSLVEPRGDPSQLDVAVPDPSRPQPFTKRPQSLDFILDAWADFSPVFVAGNYKLDTAAKTLDGPYRGWKVAIAFGRPYISNPDLVFRLKHNVPFAPYNRDTFYNEKDPMGYNDYPFCPEAITAGLAKA
ncbi:NADH:flavin oxidoreductase/NADH oxidase family protein [Cordyceps fumosorosea ARSEF 2679]|uniref:NADH:flavin oxidoreductase/NADH oxidase family protein n=1 Tax=Cordyceps fumosorosea (strain ARSEF 2679) TaxID=1081104 RepID=A0A167LCB8_CORFA|nr:NADH:flavin oxidoreductase/NADH oxidase family protein [Cordyceps fumosorosea ARSEF 2679]OAA52917.1 NADH:flavin oxidoreductase/NADH oxidase family protein [Cordyceps fumosorosea ARSEF 2679]